MNFLLKERKNDDEFFISGENFYFNFMAMCTWLRDLVRRAAGVTKKISIYFQIFDANFWTQCI